MGAESDIRGSEPQRHKLKVVQDQISNQISIICPSPGCGLAFVGLRNLEMHAIEKHGIKFNICTTKPDQATKLRRQKHQGRRVSEGLRIYHRKRKMATAPEEDLSPLLAQVF